MIGGMERIFRKTCKRYNVPDHAHFLTFSCFGRQPFLTKDRSRRWLIDALGSALVKLDFALWAWVIMPEHVHLLVKPRQKTYSISTFLRSFKQPVTRAALRHVQAYAPGFLERMLDVQPNGEYSYRFWQRGGGYDTNLWTPRFIADKIRYIHNNPVKRGLVSHAVDWEWSSARDVAKLRQAPLLPLETEAHMWLW